MSRQNISLLKQKVADLPLSPGVYQFVDVAGRIIYVGKAKSLRRRVSSYFLDSRNHSAKTRLLVSKICDIKHIVVETEADALLLENSLIKSLQPRYNILLKDDKTYPWIVVRNEPFPRVESTRKVEHGGSIYYGPYASVSMQRELLELLHAIFPLRTCKLALTPEAIAKGKYRPCLKYHIGACKAPCVELQSEEQYRASIDMVRHILRGNLKTVRDYLNTNMMEAAAELRFEEAEQLRRKLELLDGYSAKSVIVSSRMEDADVFSIIVDEAVAYVNFVRTVKGSVVNTFTAELSCSAEDDTSQILTHGIRQISERMTGRLAREVIVPVMPDVEQFPDTHFVVPKRGDKLSLLQFSERGAKIYRAEKLKNQEVRNPEKHTDRLMATMQSELRLPREPRHIECFDNSNLQGTNPVASCVVFRDGRPSKREYRHFNVKTVVGADDFASMREIVSRRYSRMLAEGSPLPDLVVVDGGKGQLSSAYEIFRELGIADRVPLVGLAKRIEEVFYPGDPTPYYLKRTGEPLKVMMHIRDEAHRFGITFHRNKRSKAFIGSALDTIPGIGPRTIEQLLGHFRTLSAIRQASLDDIATIIGPAKAKLIKEHL